MTQKITFINFNQTNGITSGNSNQETTDPGSLNNKSIFDDLKILNNTTDTTQGLGKTGNETVTTQSLWETGDGTVISQSLGETGGGTAITQSLGETGDGTVITQSLSETGDGTVITQSLGETGGEVKYTEDEKKYLDSILNKDGKIGWAEHMAFMELADKDGNGELTAAEKQAAIQSLKSDPSKVTELKNKVKAVGASYSELKDIDKKYGTNDDLKVSTEEFTQQFGSDITKLVDQNGNGQISRLEYQAFVELFDQDGDGKLLDNELQIAKKEITKSGSSGSSTTSSSTGTTDTTSGTSGSSISDQLKAIYNKLKKYNSNYVPMSSGKFDTDTSTQPKNNNETDTLDKLLDNDGKYSELEHEAFIRYADKNNDGIISDVEKEAAMKALQNDSEAAKLKAEYSKIKASEADLKSLDKSGDGKVSKEEFAAKYGKDFTEAVNLVLKTDGDIDINELLVLIKYADTNGDGKLSDDEIKAASAKLNNTDRDSKRSERAKLQNLYWKDVSIRNNSYKYMTSA